MPFSVFEGAARSKVSPVVERAASEPASDFTSPVTQPIIVEALAAQLAMNLHRLMTRQGLTATELSERTGLDIRTLRNLLAGKAGRPQPRTLQRLAEGLGVPSDELFQDPALLLHRQFDRATNPVVDQVVVERPKLFDGWTDADFDELYSRFGEGGALTREGVLHFVERMNRNRHVHEQVAAILESSEAELLTQLVTTLFQRVTAIPLSPPAPGQQPRPHDER